MFRGERLFEKQKTWEPNVRLEVSDVTHIYKTKKIELIALEHVNVQIKRGEFVAVMGPSGSGKSTLLKIICGFMLPTIGGIYYQKSDNNIVDLTGFSLEEIYKWRLFHIGYIQQHFTLFEGLTGLENVLLPKIIQQEESASRIDEEQLIKEGTDIMKYLGIDARRDHLPDELSGGEQQRICIASALIKNPEMIVADEPTGELDSKNTKIIFETFRKISKEKGISIICATHNDMIKQYCDRVINLFDGKVSDKKN